MTDLLLRLFVKDCRNTDDGAVRGAIGRLAGITGIVCNVILFAAKLAAGWMVGSVSIMADAANNLSDAASSVVTLLAFLLARRPADEDHPYGHARYEYLSALAVSALILLIGAELAGTSVGRILEPAPLEVNAAAVLVLAVTAAVKLWMSGFFTSLGKMIRSDALRATAQDSRNDVLATLAVLLGCLLSFFFDVNVDGFVGLAVAVFILWSGLKLARETISPLLGRQADPELVEKLTKLVLRHEKIMGIHDLLIHDYGPGQCFASVHAELSAREDPLVCHDIIDEIERKAMEELNVHLVIHYDPVAVGDPEWDEARLMVEQIVADLDPRLSIHDFRLVREEGSRKLVFDLAAPYSMAPRFREIKEAIDDALRERGKDYLTDIRLDGKA